MIKKLGPQDFDAFYNIRLQALSQSPHSYGNHKELWASASREQIEQMLKTSEHELGYPIFGAFVEEHCVGMLGVMRDKKKNVQHKASLWGFFVLPEYRQQGFGKALIQAALEECQSWPGLHHLRLIVTELDERAYQLFQSLGFQRYGKEENGLFLNHIYYHQIYMMRKI